MKEKFSLMIALLLAMTSVVSAAEIDDSVHTLAILFLVLCIIILIIAIVVTAILCRRHRQKNISGYTTGKKGSVYSLSERERKVSQANGKEPISFYGIYSDPQPADSIYLPLDKRTQEDGNYAHLEGSKTQEDSHTYEELKKKGTFGPTYDNPVATDKEDDNDYEIADATIVPPRSRDYDNPPPKSDTAF